MTEQCIRYAMGDADVVKFLLVAESSDGSDGAVRPFRQKSLSTTLDAEAVVGGARVVGHGAGTRQKFENKWNIDIHLGLVERYWLRRRLTL